MTENTEQNQAPAAEIDYKAEYERMKAKAARAESESIEMRKQYKPIKELGVSFDELPKILEEHKTLAQERAEREAELARKNGDFDKLLAKKDEHYTGKMKELQDQLAAVQASEHKAIVQSGLQGALAASGATAEGLDLLPGILQNQVKIETVDGQRIVRVYDIDGTPMLNSEGKAASLGDLAAKVVEKYPSLFRSSIKAGGGTPPNTAGGAGTKTITRAQFEALGHSGRASFVKEGGKITD